jgi:hypothetical protein
MPASTEVASVHVVYPLSIMAIPFSGPDFASIPCGEEASGIFFRERASLT